MTAAGPWSVKGIDPKAREIAKDLARRSGMTLGEWLNQMIIEGGEPDAPPYETQHEPQRRRQLDELYREAQAPRRTSVVPEINPAAEAAEAARVARALANLSMRMEAAEHRSTLAISGVDQSVMGVISRLDELERDRDAGLSGVSAAIDKLNDAQAGAAARMRRLEQDDGTRTEALKAVQGALERVGGQLHENGAQANAATDEIRRSLDGLAGRLERAEEAMASAPDAYADAEKVETVLTRMAERLDDAEMRTGVAVKSLESSFAGLDARIRAAEVRGGANEDMERRFQDLAAELSRKVETSRSDLVQRLRAAAGGRLDTMEQALTALGGQIEQAERRSAQAIDHVGREVMRVARNLNDKVVAVEGLLSVQGERLAEVDTRSAAVLNTVGGEVARMADTLDARMHQIDGAQAEALEKLGSEIARIAERLSERIAASDRRAAEALDGVSDTVSRISDRIEQRQVQNASELTDRIRESEARTAKLLEGARERLEMLGGGPSARLSAEPPVGAGHDPFSEAAALGASIPVAAFEGPSPHPGYAHASPPPEDAVVAPAARTFAAPLEAETLDTPGDPFADRDNEFMEFSPFDPNDDFAPAEPAVSAPFAHPIEPPAHPAAGATPSAYEPFAFAPAPSPFTETVEPPPFAEPAFGHRDPEVSAPEPAWPSYAEPAYDAQGLAEPEIAHAGYSAPASDAPAPPMSTRDMLEAARQAARRAAAGTGARNEPPPVGSIPAPAIEPLPKAPRGFGISFPSRRKKDAAPTLRTAVLASVTAGALTTAAVGAYMLGGSVHEGPSVADPTPQAPASAVAAAAPARTAPVDPAAEPHSDAAPPNAAPPNLAVALAPATPERATAKAVADARSRAELSATTAPTAAEATPKALYTVALQRLEGGDLTAVADMRKAADLGQPDAQFYLARMYEAGGAGLTRDLAQARRWTQRAAQNGQPEAMYNMASYAYSGDAGPKDLPAAVSWFRAAAEHGVVNGQYNLAQLYEKGFGVAQSSTEAYKWYLVAAASGDAGAKAAAAALKPKLAPAVQAQAEMSAATLSARIGSPVRTASAAP